MARGPRVGNEALLKAGLELMRQAGKSLSRRPSKGRAMIYDLPNGETVRARTCNDHILISVAESPDNGARLNIEGTDWLLLIMPEIERTLGRVIAYLLPTEEVVEEVRRTHRDWLDSKPNTKGKNTTRNLWFRPDGPDKASGYAEKWSKYQLHGEASTEQEAEAASLPEESAQTGSLKEEVEVSCLRVARVAGVPVEAVKITIDFGV